MKQTHNCVLWALFYITIAVLTRQYWQQIVVNVFFTYEKEKYVKIRMYFSKNK